VIKLFCPQNFFTLLKIGKSDLISEIFSLLLKSQKIYAKSLSLVGGYLSQSEKNSENKPPFKKIIH